MLTLQPQCAAHLISNLQLHSSGISYFIHLPIGVARGCTCTPSGRRKKNFFFGGGANLQEKVVSVPQAKRVLPQGRARVQFLKKIVEIWAVGEVI